MQNDVVIFEASADWKTTVEDFLIQEWLDASYSDEDIANLQETVYAPAFVADKICDPENPAKAWLALYEGAPAGMISTDDVSGGVIVGEAFRGHGIGSALINTRNDYLKATGHTIASAYVEVTNEASMSMHKKLGYEFSKASSDLVEAMNTSGVSMQDITDTADRPAILELVKNL